MTAWQRIAADHYTMWLINTYLASVLGCCQGWVQALLEAQALS